MSGKSDRKKPGEVVYPPSFHRDDEAFIDSLRAGRRAARAELYNRYADYVERLLVRVLGWNAEIPDLVQEVFVRVLSSLRGFRGDSRSLKPWIARITVRTARAWIRNRTRRGWLAIRDPVVLPDLPAEVASPEQMETLRRAYQVIERLPLKERIPFTLRFTEEMELAAIAEACDASLATIKRRLASARARFTRMAGRDPYLAQYLDDDEGSD